jgi:hypothetical protein
MERKSGRLALLRTHLKDLAPEIFHIATGSVRDKDIK